jgi:hypothetical protein
VCQSQLLPEQRFAALLYLSTFHCSNEVFGCADESDHSVALSVSTVIRIKCIRDETRRSVYTESSGSTSVTLHTSSWALCKYHW